MDFYDLAYPDAIKPGTPEKLGFKAIYAIDSDVAVARDPAKAAGAVFVGSGVGLERAVKAGARMVVPEDYRLEPKTIALMEDREAAIGISTYPIMASDGLRRARRLYHAGRMLTVTSKKDVDISFVTLARSELYLCSAQQLIGLAKLIGATDEQARDSIGRVNRLIK